MRALACPASLKGVLTAAAAAAALAEGLRAAGADAVELPVADGGEGTAEALWLARGGEWREADVHDAFGAARRARWLVLPEGTAVVEAAAAVPLDPGRLDPLARVEPRLRRARRRSARATGRRASCSALGGTATMDAGAGFLEVFDRAAGAGARRVRRDRDAARGAASLRPAEGRGRGGDRGARARVSPLREKTLCLSDTRPARARRAGSAPRSRRSAPSSCPGAAYVLDAVGFDAEAVRSRRHRGGPRRRDDGARQSAWRGRAPRRRGRCVVFGGIVERRSTAPRPLRCRATRSGRGRTSSRWEGT